MERARREHRGGGLPRCSFCGRSRAETSYLHAGAPEWPQICNGCVYGARAKRSEGPGRARRCSFCGATAKEREWIYGGSTIAICDRCVDGCLEEIAAS